MAHLEDIAEFGTIDAESEAQLGDFFVRTDPYQRIEDQEHIVVVGRKGTGKTAIYKTMVDRGGEFEDVFVTGLQFREYPWGVHSEVQDGTAASVERYSASWKFLILVELAKLILTDSRHEVAEDPRSRAAARTLTRFIETNWGELGFQFRDIFNKRKFTFNFEPKVMGNSLGALSMDDVPRDRLAGVLVEANRWLTACLELLLTEDRWYYVLFDDLDVGYGPDDAEYAGRLVGLLLAAREIYNWGREHKLDVAPIVFIREDIYDELSFPDKNKITQNLVETLTWTDDENSANSLKALISRRIQVITGNGGGNPWAEIFDDQLMRGTQTKFKHMAARTYLRPRDMIQFSNLCLLEAQKAGEERIQNQNLASARPEYSEYLISELHDEIHTVFEDWRKYLDVLRRIHTMRFQRARFDEVFGELKLDRLGGTPDDALELLYRFSVIGFTKIGGAGYGGSATAFRHRDPSVNFDPAAPYYNVHLGLKEALELVEAGEGAAARD